jgi:putative phosphoesterase
MIKGDNMTKIAIFSDTHRDEKAINIMKEISKKVDFLIHLGDNITDINSNIACVTYNVKGNCDRNIDFIENSLIKIENYNFFLTHGHLYSFDSLYYKAKEENANFVLFGHTHVALIEKYENIYFVNPGSIPHPRDNTKGTYAILNIDNNRNVDIKIIYL